MVMDGDFFLLKEPGNLQLPLSNLYANVTLANRRTASLTLLPPPPNLIIA